MPKSPARNLKPLILVAEDVRALSLRITHVLESKGYRTAVAEDGEACLAKAQELSPHALFLDLMMPRLNGMEVLKRLRSNPATQSLPVIVCTAKGFVTDIRELIDLGVNEIVIKPFENSTILEKVEACLQDPHQLLPPARSAIRPVPSEVYSPSLDPSRAKVTLWGTRGSIPVSGPRYARHGGNTTCASYSCGEHHILFDAGSGIREAGIAALQNGPRHLHLFMTHAHWDHVQGFPFFAPLYVPGFEITVYGEDGFGQTFEHLMTSQMDRDHFPAERRDFRAKVHFQVLRGEPVSIGSIKVSQTATNHPGVTQAYKLKHRGKTFAFVPDNEFLQGYLGDPKHIQPESDLVVPQQPLIEFLQGVDVLIHEAQYLASEYQGKIGWGHSTIANACALVRLTAPKKWIVVHHDPGHDDAFLDEKLQLTRQILRGLGSTAQVVHGYDGMTENL
ncbi:MAG: hypothetical protein RLZZ244_1103 [Verrucomicrobiota bacterium]|jgi:CheY-like chemotaxis protein